MRVLLGADLLKYCQSIQAVTFFWKKRCGSTFDIGILELRVGCEEANTKDVFANEEHEGRKEGRVRGFSPPPLGVCISFTQKSIALMSYTCNRFLEHFKTPEEKENDNRLPEVAFENLNLNFERRR